MGKGLFEGNLPTITVAVVFRAVIALDNRAVIDLAVGCHPAAQGCGVNEQLERGTGLAFGLRGAVKGRFLIAFATNHGDDFAIGAHRDQRHLCIAERRARDDLAGDVLQAGIERGADDLIRIAGFGIKPRLRHSPIGEISAGGQRFLIAHIDLRDRRGVGLRFAYCARCNHRIQDQLGPLSRALGIAGGGKPVRRLHQSGKHRCLRQRQIFGLAIEIMHRCGAQAVDIVAEIGVRQITFEDFVLGQPCLQPEGDEGLAGLSRQALFGREEGEFGKLLRDRAAALLDTAAKGVAP